MPADDRQARTPQEPPRKPDRHEVDRVFGDVLPDTTADERDPAERSGASDSWYLENRPPHHDH